MFTRGEANLVVDESPYNLAYNFASVEAEPLSLEGTLLVDDGSYISTMVVWIDEQMADPQYETVCPVSSQCVSLLKENGFDIHGNAWDLKANTQDPCRGCAILLKRHVGLVTNYDRDYVCLKEKNFLGCGVINNRCISRTDKSIRGYIIP